MKDHPYILLIEETLKRDLSYDDALKLTGLEEKELNRAGETLFENPSYDELRSYTRNGKDRKTPISWTISPNAFFGYLSHLQREDSNRHAWITHLMVGVSIFISLLGLGISAGTLLVIFYGWGATGCGD
ncbi:hypothetical protein [Halorhodospira neutriphila]|uniref:hypothetical protein n=1 Tax=Halorhodospira neutriphila TaxID=168379 RepID=UPI001A9221C3|nr:hypothetical protein [Halorhodospira neutriphila]